MVESLTNINDTDHVMALTNSDGYYFSNTLEDIKPTDLKKVVVDDQK